MTKKKTLLLFWIFALFPIIFGAIGDLLVKVNFLHDDGSGGPALLILLSPFTILVGLIGHIYTSFYYKRISRIDLQKSETSLIHPIFFLIIICTICLFIAISSID